MTPQEAKEFLKEWLQRNDPPIKDIVIYHKQINGEIQEYTYTYLLRLSQKA